MGWSPQQLNAENGRIQSKDLLGGSPQSWGFSRFCTEKASDRKSIEKICHRQAAARIATFWGSVHWSRKTTARAGSFPGTQRLMCRSVNASSSSLAPTSVCRVVSLLFSVPPQQDLGKADPEGSPREYGWGQHFCGSLFRGWDW